MPLKSHHCRQVVLVGTAITLTTLLIKTATSSTPKTPTHDAFTPPASLPLSGWQQIAISPQPVQPNQMVAGDVISAHHYGYKQNNNTLDLTLSYLVNTDGDLKTAITAQTPQLSTALKQDANGNHYSLFSTEGVVRLETCLNARGPATVTSDQFSRNRMVYDTRLDRVIPWFTGQATLPDQRCLWVRLSTPLSQHSSEKGAYQGLEDAWDDISRQISTF
ncbi:MAG: cyanoexosortase A system-associated protein [Cyanobacteria bacterium J06606_4]